MGDWGKKWWIRGKRRKHNAKEEAKQKIMHVYKNDKTASI
jgi:hypothetical protein